MYEILKPKSEHLRKYIQEITVLNENEVFPKEYFAFPHNISAIVFLQNSKIVYKSNSLEINRIQTNNTSAFSIGKYIEPLFVRYKHFVNEIAINFTPTGLNYFFDKKIF